MHAAHRTRIATTPRIKVTKENLGRLDALLGSDTPIRSWRAAEFLVRKLMRARVVDEHAIPARVVTMRSQIKFREEDNRLQKVATLAYPGDSGLYDDAISVLTPVGAILLGLSEGQCMAYSGPDGTLKRITLTKILYQPEAVQRARFSGRGASHREPVAERSAAGAGRGKVLVLANAVFRDRNPVPGRLISD
jgi:regulator of nucleoside diphosphate kinase